MVNFKKMSQETGIPESRIRKAHATSYFYSPTQTLKEALRNYKKANTEKEEDIALKQIGRFYQS